MKKMISTLLSVTPILFATAGQVNTQGADKDITFIPAKNYAAYVAFITPYGGADIRMVVQIIVHQWLPKTPLHLFPTTL